MKRITEPTTRNPYKSMSMEVFVKLGKINCIKR